MTEQILTQEQDNTGGGFLNLGNIVLLVGVLVTVGVIGWALLDNNTETQPMSGPAPDFTITTYDGQEFTLSEQRGEIVVVNFWASWCGPCRAEAPDLQAIHERYADQGVTVVGVSYLDTERDARAFIEEYGLTYLNGPDIGTDITDQRYHVQAVPENFIIDREGNVHYAHLGPIDEATLESVLQELLREDAA